MAEVENRQRKLKFRGIKFLLIVVVFYIFIFYRDYTHALSALKSSLLVLTEVLPILVIVIIFTAILNYFLKPEQIARHLGEEGGWRGWIISLISGILSHGPMYIWYPMIEDLKKHGLRNGYIAAFFYSRAIKLPLLPIMVHYFGWLFVLLLSLYTVFAAWIQGKIIDKLEKKG